MTIALTTKKISRIVGGMLRNESKTRDRISGVSTDSRRILPGQLFVPLAGEQYDGHDFLAAAFEAGARCAFVNEAWHREHAPALPADRSLIVVQDALMALQTLAAWYRMQFYIPVIAVTGSSGKTTTKDMIATVLAQRFNVLKTPGNLNSQIGAPQVLLSLQREHQMVVLELGMNHPGEMSRLGAMTRPDVAVVTNVGPVHLEYLESMEGVGQAKGELLDYLSPDGHAILNADDPHVMAQRGRTPARLITFARNAPADVKAASIAARIDGSTFQLEDGAGFALRIPGEHHVMNALAAIAVGRLFDIPDDCIGAALAELNPAPMRMNYLQIGRLHVLFDAYNANPVSTRAALKTLAMSGGRRIAILGDMLELGDISPAAHREVGTAVAETADLLVAVGSRALQIAEGALKAGMPEAHIVRCQTNAEAVDRLKAIAHPDDFLLIKGSRGMKMEEVASGLETAFGEKPHEMLHHSS